MTSILTNDYLRINGRIIPAEYMPDWCNGVEPPASTGETNLFGALVGARGGATCVMGWDMCPETVYRWWFNEFWGADLLSLPLTDLVIADPAGLGLPFLPERHINNRMGQFDWAMMHRITRDGSKREYWDVLSKRKPYIMGATITITMIGTVPPL